jgi:hypothetical protein
MKFFITNVFYPNNCHDAPDSKTLGKKNKNPHMSTTYVMHCVIWLDIIRFFIYKGYIMKIVELTNTQLRLETHAINNIHSYEVVKRR